MFKENIYKVYGGKKGPQATIVDKGSNGGIFTEIP